MGTKLSDSQNNKVSKLEDSLITREAKQHAKTLPSQADLLGNLRVSSVSSTRTV